MPKLTNAVALDCEMVGVGLFGDQDMVARVSLVNEYGECIMDTFVKPTRKVVDYRTPVSGVRKSDLENAEDFDEIQEKVKNILRGRILVGHGLMEHDLKVLKLTHPVSDTRDTAEYAPFKRMSKDKEWTRVVALDCEMVGVGPRYPRQDMLARVSLVNEHGQCILDTFVKPTRKVTDYRTHISGVRKADLDGGQDFDKVQMKVKEILKDRIVVGHGVDHDFEMLALAHPKHDIRDTSEYLPFQRMNNNRRPALRWLAKRLLGATIQNGEHSSIEDAKAVMRVYKKVAAKWEKSLGN